MNYAILISDPDGNVTAWNAVAERLFGYSDQEAIGLSLTHFFTREDLERDELNQQLRAAKQGHTEDDRWMVRKDGSQFWASSFTTPLHDDTGCLIGYGLVIRDFTEQREMGNHVEEFLAVLGHELRNPLAPIRNVLEMFRGQDFKPPSLRQAFGILDRQVMNLTRLVDDLIQASRITRGRVELKKEQTELAAVVNLAVETTRPIIDERGHALDLRLPLESIPLEVDVSRLAQVFGCLLDNAARYTPLPGQICLIAERHGERVEVRVQDQGIGIPADMLEAVFRLFVQVGRTMSRAEGGLGIGLAVARSLVEMHGGTVQAYSKGLGRGSEVIFRLALAVRDSAA